MKKLIIAALMLATTPAFAGGKLILQGTRSFTVDRDIVPSLLGVSIYENLGKSPFYYESMTGLSKSEYGEGDDLHRDAYFSKQMLGLRFFKTVEVSGGYMFLHVPQAASTEHRAIVRVAIKLF